MRKSCSIFIWVFYTILFDIIEYKMLYKFRKKKLPVWLLGHNCHYNFLKKSSLLYMLLNCHLRDSISIHVTRFPPA